MEKVVALECTSERRVSSSSHIVCQLGPAYLYRHPSLQLLKYHAEGQSKESAIFQPPITSYCSLASNEGCD